MEAQERKLESRNSQRSHQSSINMGTPSQRSQNNPLLNAKVLGDKLRIAKLRLPEADPDTIMN